MLAMLSTQAAVRRCAGASALALALLGAGLPAAAAADRPQPDLSRFYGQKPVWGACEGPDMPKDLQCAKVTVPIDYARPGAGTLDVALARYRATGESQGSVLLNFGGPGGAGIPELASEGRQFMDLTSGYDVVTFDPRGVGRSSPVSCGEGSDEASAVAEKDADIGHPQALFKQLKQAAAQCARHSGPVLPHIGTINASRDMDVIRQALGDDKLNYLGFSYGSRLGAVYAAQFPGKVGRITLDGVDTLTESLAEQGVAGAEGQQTALEDFLDWCTTDVGCPFGQDRRTAGDEVLRLVRSLDEDPLPTGLGGKLSGQDLVGAIGQALYSKELWPSLQRALVSLVEDGDARRVLAFSTGGMEPPRDRHPTDGGLVDAEDVPSDNLVAALMAINCADDPDRPAAARPQQGPGRTADRVRRGLAGLRPLPAHPAAHVLRPPQGHRLHPRPGEERALGEDAARGHARGPGDAVPVGRGDRPAARLVGGGARQQGRGPHRVLLVQVRAPQGQRLPALRLTAPRTAVPARRTRPPAAPRNTATDGAGGRPRAAGR
ncbi:hypothetical protein GCM10017687_04290 [Streptomyces echinatus]